MTKTQPKNYSEQIAQFNWYQQIPLGNGGHTPGEDNFTEEKLPMLKMPTDLSGRSVLDIGCSEGYFGREAERRGAERILGIDKAEKLVEKNALLREITGSRMTYEEKTVYDLDPINDGKFDLVIFLSVFQHLDYPFRALDVIAEVTSTTAVMEIPIAVANNNADAFQLEHTQSHAGVRKAGVFFCLMRHCCLRCYWMQGLPRRTLLRATGHGMCQGTTLASDKNA